MLYDQIVEQCKDLHYRDKLRLSQLLIQLARKEEEMLNPTKRTDISENQKNSIEYIIERIGKLRPSKRTSLTNSIRTMYQFQGGINDQEIEQVIDKLQSLRVLKIDNNKVTYL